MGRDSYGGTAIVGLTQVASVQGSVGEQDRDGLVLNGVPTYADAFDRLMPLASDERVPNDVAWRVTIRSSDGGFRDRELWIRFNVGWSQALYGTLEVVEAETDDMAAQLIQLRDENPDATGEEIVDQVALVRHQLDEAQCPQATNLIREFATMRIAAVPDSAITLDAGTIEMVVETRTERLTLSFTASEGDANPALYRWVTALEQLARSECR